VRQLDIKVLNIVDARCNHEVYNQAVITAIIPVNRVVVVEESMLDGEV